MTSVNLLDSIFFGWFGIVFLLLQAACIMQGAVMLRSCDPKEKNLKPKIIGMGPILLVVFIGIIAIPFTMGSSILLSVIAGMAALPILLVFMFVTRLLATR